MAAWMLPAAMAVAGAAKGMMEDSDRQAYNTGQAELTRYSPWTGMKGRIQQGSLGSSMFGGAMQGGMAGMSAIQGMKDEKPVDDFEIEKKKSVFAKTHPFKSSPVASNWGQTSRISPWRI